jgi:hypothetical protein
MRFWKRDAAELKNGCKLLPEKDFVFCLGNYTSGPEFRQFESRSGGILNRSFDRRHDRRHRSDDLDID